MVATLYGLLLKGLVTKNSSKHFSKLESNVITNQNRRQILSQLTFQAVMNMSVKLMMKWSSYSLIKVWSLIKSLMKPPRRESKLPRPPRSRKLRNWVYLNVSRSSLNAIHKNLSMISGRMMSRKSQKMKATCHYFKPTSIILKMEWALKPLNLFAKLVLM